MNHASLTLPIPVVFVLSYNESDILMAVPFECGL
jgi:hypothetical protein